MKQLPESYVSYLDGKDENFIATVKPILQQSAADQIHGVRVVKDRQTLQAHLDDKVPFGQIVEATD